MNNNKLFVYVEGFAGNGFEDAGVEIHVTKMFVNKADAIAYSLMRVAGICESSEEVVDYKRIEENFNGLINTDTGHWELVPESTIFGLVKELS
ncbi:MAG: hypothetical protein ACO27Q_10745 [Bacteroidia bacterium]